MENLKSITSFQEVPTFYGLSFPPHRDRSLGADAVSFFPYESAIAAISIAFFRSTVRLSDEPASLRWFFSILLAFLAYSKRNYELITAVELFSYAIPLLLTVKDHKADHNKRQRAVHWLFFIASSAFLSFFMAHMIVSGKLSSLLTMLLPSQVWQFIDYMLPMHEMKAAYDIMVSFAQPAVLQKQVAHLLFVTFHCQVGMGYIGIDFLRQDQDRKNQLIRLDLEKSTTSGTNGVSSSTKSTKANTMENAKRFQRGAVPFILFVAMPYMFQIVTYGNINKFAFLCLRHDVHRVIRLNELFDHDNHLLAMAKDAPYSPEGYANSIVEILNTAYDLVNRKLFSLPKILLLPGILSREPMLVAQVFPFIFLSDYFKATVVSFLTKKVEELDKQISELRTIRTKVEQFDIKNAELLQRSGAGAMQFTQRRWEELTVRVQSRLVLSDLINRSKDFFSFMQRNFVFSTLIDCALANLIAIGKIGSADMFVFWRAFEDAVDMILMRSRAEAQLARMMTEVGKLEKLAEIWDKSKKRSLLPCILSPPGSKALVLRNLVYSRGTARVRADHLELCPGVYALTGSNGSGKSTLFRLLMSCSSNEKSIDLPVSINLLTPMEPLEEEDDVFREQSCVSPLIDDDDDDSQECEVNLDGTLATPQSSTSSHPHHHPKLSITMPSADVVEISQNFYWPLHSRPIDWIFQEHVVDTCNETVLAERTRRIASELQELEFFQAAAIPQSDGNSTGNTSSTEDIISSIVTELLEEKEDWFNNLSGGQKSKVEVVRKVFLHEHCPDVLLIDETMAPLDPASKSIVMSKLKRFCSESIIIVIYHTDVNRGKDVEGAAVECVPANDFFDKNIHLDKGIMHMRETC